MPYLERPAIDATFRYIASLPEKTAVAFDYSVPPESMSWTSRLIFNAMASRVAAIGEPWKTFFDPATLLADLRRLGFTSAEDFGAEALNTCYFAGARTSCASAVLGTWPWREGLIKPVTSRGSMHAVSLQGGCRRSAVLRRPR